MVLYYYLCKHNNYNCKWSPVWHVSTCIDYFQVIIKHIEVFFNLCGLFWGYFKVYSGFGCLFYLHDCWWCGMCTGLCYWFSGCFPRFVLLVLCVCVCTTCKTQWRAVCCHTTSKAWFSIECKSCIWMIVCESCCCDCTTCRAWLSIQFRVQPVHTDFMEQSLSEAYQDIPILCGTQQLVPVHRILPLDTLLFQ